MQLIICSLTYNTKFYFNTDDRTMKKSESKNFVKKLQKKIEKSVNIKILKHNKIISGYTKSNTMLCFFIAKV